jgi:hypothetical protein
MVVHVCHPTYLGGEDRMLWSLRPTQAKLVRHYLKKETHE